MSERDENRKTNLGNNHLLTIFVDNFVEKAVATPISR
jgi:hypothetical protein